MTILLTFATLVFVSVFILFLFKKMTKKEPGTKSETDATSVALQKNSESKTKAGLLQIAVAIMVIIFTALLLYITNPELFDSPIGPAILIVIFVAIIGALPGKTKHASYVTAFVVISIIGYVTVNYFIGQDGIDYIRSEAKVWVITKTKSSVNYGEWQQYIAPPKGTSRKTIPIGWNNACYDANANKTYHLYKLGFKTRNFRYEIESMTDNPAIAFIGIARNDAELKLISPDC